MNVGEYIKELRLAAGYSQGKLGELLGVQRAAVQKWECGAVQNLKRETIKKMATLFNVSPSSFIIGDSDSAQIILTSHEEKVIAAYRDKPLVQPHVDKLLDIEPETDAAIIPLFPDPKSPINNWDDQHVSSLKLADDSFSLVAPPEWPEPPPDDNKS